jgi:hypothetical protein
MCSVFWGLCGPATAFQFRAAMLELPVVPCKITMPCPNSEWAESGVAETAIVLLALWEGNWSILLVLLVCRLEVNMVNIPSWPWAGRGQGGALRTADVASIHLVLSSRIAQGALSRPKIVNHEDTGDVRQYIEGLTGSKRARYTIS